MGIFRLGGVDRGWSRTDEDAVSRQTSKVGRLVKVMIDDR